MLRQGHTKASLFSFPFLPPTSSMSSVISSTMDLLGIYPYYKLAASFFSVMLFRQLNDMPVNKPWVVYDEWRKSYGKTSIINGLSPQITGQFRWYDIPQCSWPTLCNIKFLESHHRPVLEKIVKLLRQKADDYDDWTVCIITFLSPQKMTFDAEWVWISAWPGCHTACGCKNTGNCFTSISTVTRWLNTNLSKDKSFKYFCVNLSHPTTSFTTFDSKHRF